MGYTASDYQAVLHDYFDTDKIKELSYAEEPFWAMVPKESAGGKRYVQPVEYAKPGGASSVYGTAKTNGNKAKSKYEDFLLTRKPQFQRVQMDIELLLSSKDPKGSFQDSFKEFNRGFRSLGEKIGRRLFRTAGGSIGKMANAAVNVTTIQLNDKADAFNVEIGDTLQFAAADGTGALRDAGDTTDVVNVDYETGIITVSDQLDTKITGIAVGDYLFIQDDFGACLSGIDDWLPIANRAARLAATFNGVLRSQNPVRLGGVTMDGTGFGGLDEVLIKLVGKVGKHGGSTSHIFMNPETITDLQLTANAKVLLPQEIRTNMRSQESGEVIVGFSGFRVQIGDKTVKVYGARSCPSNKVFALQMDTWKYWHLGEPINWLNEILGGNKIDKDPNAPEYYADLGNYGELGCSAPAWNGAALINPSMS